MKVVHILLMLAMLLFLPTVVFSAGSEENNEVKIGFVVKDAQEPWFLDEWKFAEIAAKEKGFTLVKIGASDGEQVVAALDNLGAQQAQGVIICVPDVKLGTAVVARAKANNLKLMSVDDRLLGNDGAPIEEVVHMGIDAFEIGKLVGTAIADEMKARSWKPEDTYAIRVSLNELPTSKNRTDGATEALLANGFLAENIIESPRKTPTTEGAFDAANIAIAKNPEAKNWVAFASNDAGVLGAVRALEGNGVPKSNIIGVGINGSDFAIDEFEKDEATGFFGTIIISPKRHGYETSTNMHEWIVNGTEPPKLTYTSGKLATRNDYSQVRKDLGLE